MIPTNEQSTIVLFAKLADEMGYKFKEIGTHCPDAILEKNGSVIRVEFEHMAKTFRVHRHNPEDVDLIICWEDDWPDSPIPVLSLEHYMALTRPEAPQSWLERMMNAIINARRIWRQRIRMCPICGADTQVRCVDGGYGLLIWRSCSGCGYNDESEY